MPMYCCPYEGTGQTCPIHGPTKVSKERTCFNCGEQFVLEKDEHVCPHCGINIVPQPEKSLGAEFVRFFKQS